MGDMADVFNDMKRNKKERHSNNFNSNLSFLIAQTDIPNLKFELKSTVCLFRDKNKPNVDFYPHTGRWKVSNKMFKGGARKFISWYKNY